MSSISVCGLAVTAVKGMRVGAVQQIELGPRGACGNRAFYVVDERGRMVNGKQIGQLHTIVPDYDPAVGTLSLTFPDGTRVAGSVDYDGIVATRFFSRARDARRLRGPWSEALSAFVGRPLTLVESETSVDRGRAGSASIISRSSLGRLAQVAQRDAVDARRFRMLIEIDGVGAHEEDEWVGHRVQVGEARLVMHGHVGRCLVTSRHPENGEIDLPTLDLLGSYRRELASTEPLPFGVYGEVLQGATVRIGDPVAVAD